MQGQRMGQNPVAYQQWRVTCKPTNYLTCQPSQPLFEWPTYVAYNMQPPTAHVPTATLVKFYVHAVLCNAMQADMTFCSPRSESVTVPPLLKHIALAASACWRKIFTKTPTPWRAILLLNAPPAAPNKPLPQNQVC